MTQTFRKLLTYHLKKEGFEVVSFSKGVELLERVKEEKPDLFILDVMVPSWMALGWQTSSGPLLKPRMCQ
jgi:DNA-binding response OmpR family regulator